MDNFFTSVDLAKDLAGKQTYLTGTIRPRSNRRGYPKTLKRASLHVDEVIYMKSDMQLAAAYKEKAKRKSINFLSTYCDAISETKPGSSRDPHHLYPQVKTVYDKYMGGVDLSDMMMYCYMDERKGRKHHRKVVINIIHRALLNSYILYSQHSSDSPKLTRQKYQLQILTFTLGIFSINYSRERDANLTNLHEIKALLGIIYSLGVMKANELNTDDAWARDSTGLCTIAMSENRFRFLLKVIRFDDKATRNERLRQDKSAAGTGRNVTMDNWFTSSLALKLLHQFRLTIIGTLKRKKKEIPSEFVISRVRNVHTSVFGFQSEMTLLSYKPKENKVVLMLSTMHHDANIDDSTGELKKPEMIMFYNITKGGVDVMDEMTATYNCARNSRRWPVLRTLDVFPRDAAERDLVTSG
ncbi:hypothetical protein LAZ67_6002877 [Cordylochernes scorpioides]|uniref:PiggyBac transposable element-derived protein domain-containing protein n=1 Tax=Cordylochernes scorpioides TaxID=51811 RepID=A0ABY6KN93_9ARAC|nr:hypothetical protein LAZ67_6002877 [Cordylochernes scorpioides]